MLFKTLFFLLFLSAISQNIRFERHHTGIILDSYEKSTHTHYTIGIKKKPITSSHYLAPHMHKVTAGPDFKHQFSLISAVGEYSALFTLGTPAQNFGAQIDTGSSTIAIQSSKCGTAGCIDPPDYPGYNQSASTSSANVLCTDPRCVGNYCSINEPANCGIGVSYGDGSGWNGSFIDETFSFNMSAPAYASITFAQILEETTGFEPAEFGIIGVAYKSLNCNPNGACFPTVIDSYFAQNKISRDQFTMCLSHSFGDMYLGETFPEQLPKEKYVYTPILKSEFAQVSDYYFYSIKATSLIMDDFVFTDWASYELPIIDSGTTLTLVPAPVFTGIYNALVKYCKSSGILANFDSTCEEFFSGDTILPLTHNIIYSMPSYNVSFIDYEDTKEEFHVTINPSAYMWEALPGLYTLGIMGLDPGETGPIIFGDTFMKSVSVVFDRTATRLGFQLQEDCLPIGTIYRTINDKSNKKSSTNLSGWEIALIVVLSTGFAGFLGFAIYKYRKPNEQPFHDRTISSSTDNSGIDYSSA